jgi:hypothetical protein
VTPGHRQFSFTSLTSFPSIKKPAEGRILPAGSVLIRLASRFGDIGGLGTFGPLDDLEFDGISFLQRAVAIAHDGGVVNKYIWSVISPDKSVAFRVIKPLNVSLHFLKPPCGASSGSDHDAPEKFSIATSTISASVPEQKVPSIE